MKRFTRFALLCSLCLLGVTPAFADVPAESDVSEAMRAAEAGDATAQLKLGDMYDLGQGVPQDFAKAVVWYRQSAEQGNAQAQFALAEMYKNGDGVEQDMDTARDWYRASAEQGHAGAQLLLGVLYESGTGVAEDLGEAARWYLLSANSGDARAQLLLANLYNLGQGVSRNPVVAFALYTVSMETDARGNPASRHRADLARDMTAEEIESATLLASEMSAAESPPPDALRSALNRYLAGPDSKERPN